MAKKIEYDREGPSPDETFQPPEGYWEKLKAIVRGHPKGKPLDQDGKFYPDPTPVAPPIGYQPEQSMFDRMRELVKREISAKAEEHGMESFEEADDFEVWDDPEPFSEYERIIEQAVPDGPLTDPEAPKPPEVPQTHQRPPEGVPGASAAGGTPPPSPPKGD